jgi:hypothetical protein
MTDTSHTRRGAIAAAALTLTAAAAFGARATPQTGETIMTDAATGHEHDWDWLVGRWNVRHHKLKARLAGSAEWEDFAGTSVLWLTLGGLGTVDDNVFSAPGGTYRAVGVRAYDVKSGEWSIWWLDERNPTIDPPVKGGFKNGVGEFSAPDTLNGRPIVVRYRWSEITPTSARWEQAFSPDGGATWEVNWIMRFERAA